MSLTGAGSYGQEPLPFKFDKTKEAQSLLVSNHVVRSARFLTKLKPMQMFTTLGLDNKDLDHHMKVAHNLIYKVNLIPILFFNILV